MQVYTRDPDVLMCALKEFTNKTLAKDKKPSILKQMVQYQQKIKNIAKDKVKNRNKGGYEL